MDFFAVITSESARQASLRAEYEAEFSRRFQTERPGS
jgi:hypothetical protein